MAHDEFDFGCPKLSHRVTPMYKKQLHSLHGLSHTLFKVPSLLTTKKDKEASKSVVSYTFSLYMELVACVQTIPTSCLRQRKKHMSYRETYALCVGSLGLLQYACLI